MNNKYEVKEVSFKECKDWFLNIHYAKRVPSVSYRFGLYADGKLLGICSYGKPASNNLCKGCFGADNSHLVYELNRLVVIEGLGKNVLSYFVGQTFKLLPKPIILVSYADSDMNHHGYIYQATNWIYSGATKARTDVDSGANSHSRHYDKASIDYTKRKFRSSKHRYFMVLADKRVKKRLMGDFNYKTEPYPKGDNSRYDIDESKIVRTKTLFDIS